MPPKASQSLDDLRAQARLTFRYWPIYLMLRLREVEQHLSPAERQQIGAVFSNRPLLETGQQTNQDITILIEYGLLAGSETLPQIDPQAPAALPTADDYFFRVGPTLAGSYFKRDYASLDFVALLASQPRRVEILRVRQQDTTTLQRASEALSLMAAELSPELAFEASRLWAVLHGARLLDWQTIPDAVLNDYLPTVQTASAVSAPQQTYPLPPRRKRGKGLFRDPH